MAVMIAIQKIKEKRTIKGKLKEKIKSAPKELVRHGLDNGAKHLRGQLREAAQRGQANDYGGDRIEDTAVRGANQTRRGVDSLLKKKKTARGRKQDGEPHTDDPSTPQEIPKGCSPSCSGSAQLRWWAGLAHPAQTVCRLASSGIPDTRPVQKGGQSVLKTARSERKTAERIARQTDKAVERSFRKTIKTTQRTARTAQQTVKIAQKSAQATVKATQKAIQMSETRQRRRQPEAKVARRPGWTYSRYSPLRLSERQTEPPWLSWTQIQWRSCGHGVLGYS